MKDKINKSINNQFEQDLIDNGYTIFEDNRKNAIRGFRKRFDDEHGIKYFITGYHYNHHKQLFRTDIPDRDSYTFDIQFRLEKSTKDKTVDIHFSADFLPNEYREITTLKEVEDFYEKCFIALNAEYYERND